MKNTYGCDSCSERKDWDSEINWYTSSIGFCECCWNKLHKRVPQSILDFAYDICDGNGKEANEMAQFIIDMAR